MKRILTTTFLALAFATVGILPPAVDATEAFPRHPIPASDDRPSSFQIRRRTLQHREIVEDIKHEKRLLGLIPDLGDIGKNEGEAGQNSQTGSQPSAPSSSPDASPGSSQTSPGQWTRMPEHGAWSRPMQSSDQVPLHSLAHPVELIRSRQLLSGVGSVIGGVADGIGQAASGVGSAVGNALGGNDSGSDQGSSGSDGGDESSTRSPSSSSSSTPPLTSSVSNTGTNNGNSVSNTPSSSRKPTSASTSPGTSESNTPGPSGNSGASSSAAAQRQSSAAAASSSSSAIAAAQQASQSAVTQASILSASAASAASASAASIASESVNNAIAATSIDASSTSAPVLISTSVPGGTTVITSIDSLQPTGTAGVYGGSTGGGRGGSSDASEGEASPNDGKLSTAAIVGIAVPIGVIACIVIVWTVIRKRQQANTRALHPLDFAPAYGSADEPNTNGLTRRSQESWLGGGGRRMSGISDVEPEMMPPMEEMSHDDHLMRSGPHGGHFYNESMALSVPPTVYSAAAGAGSRRLSVVDSANSHGYEYADGMSSQQHQYYDGSSAAGYQTSAVRGVDLAGLQRSGTGGSTSPYQGTQRGEKAPMHGYDFRPDLDEPVRPSEISDYEEAYADTSDPFQHAELPGAPAMTKSSSRWSG